MTVIIKFLSDWFAHSKLIRQNMQICIEISALPLQMLLGIILPG